MVLGDSKEYVHIGPWGDVGSTRLFDYKPEGIITEIVVHHDRGVWSKIRSIKFKSKTDDGAISSSEEFGYYNYRDTYDTVTIGAGEYIIGIEFSIDDSRLTSLSISTNKKKYGPFGRVSGTITSIQIADGYIVGFFGWYLDTLDAIGIYAIPKAQSTIRVQENKAGNSVMSIGPWGSSEGQPWTYLPQGLLTKIVIKYGYCIDSLFFECKARDGAVTSAKFGGSGGRKTNEVIIGTGEYITGIDIIVGEYDGHKVINQLTIQTNAKKYGPFGTSEGSKISVPMKNGGVVGFFGLSGLYLNAIGIFATKCPFPQDKDDKPVVKPNPGVVKPKPTVVNPKPTVVNPKPTVVNPKPTVVNPKPAVVNLDPTTVRPDPVIMETVCPDEIAQMGSYAKGIGVSGINKIFLNINIDVELNYSD